MSAAVIARLPSSRVFSWPVWASAVVHAASLVLLASVGTLAPRHAPTAIPLSIELVGPETPPAPHSEPTPPPPKPPVVRIAPTARTTAPPRDVPVETPSTPSTPAPAAAAPALIDDEQRRAPSPSSAPSADVPERALPGAGTGGGPFPGMRGETTGTGDTLLSTGDLPVGNPGGGGGAGGASTTATCGAGSSASATDGSAAGLTSFARPRGGYQTRPRYPDAARREGVEGEVLLRFQVLGNGHVGAVTVTRSAGRDDLDRAAVEAVKTWLFDPARRGKEPVTVWVTLPVRFQLGSSKD